MKPQSKITVFMVVMIVMLSIYYFTLGGDKTKETGNQDPTNTPVFRYEEYELLRAQLTDSRQALISQLQSNMVSADVSLDDKNLAINTMLEINNMTNKEFSFETSLRNLGYLDVFVTSTASTSDAKKVDVRVLDSEHSAAEVRSIINLGKDLFGSDFNVEVKFDTQSESTDMY
jgi:stage III sporulation protein AH